MWSVIPAIRGLCQCHSNVADYTPWGLQITERQFPMPMYSHFSRSADVNIHMALLLRSSFSTTSRYSSL